MMQVYHIRKTILESAYSIHRMTRIHWSNVGPDLRGMRGASGVEIGAALSRVGPESGPDLNSSDRASYFPAQN
jgi:hypothetical protein